MVITEVLDGWKLCEPPRWWNPRREMKKWKEPPKTLHFRGKHFKYKAVYKRSKNMFGSAASRFANSYVFYKKK
jgi:hypothetical protein